MKIPRWLLAASGWLALVSILMFVMGIVLVPVIVLRLPDDFFLHEDEPRWLWPHTMQGWLLWAVRNLLGAILVLAGVSMLVLPGQGILTIVAGLMAMTLPGKRSMIRWLVHQGRVQRSLNWIRQHGGRAPFKFLR